MQRSLGSMRLAPYFSSLDVQGFVGYVAGCSQPTELDLGSLQLLGDALPSELLRLARLQRLNPSCCEQLRDVSSIAEAPLTHLNLSGTSVSRLPPCGAYLSMLQELLLGTYHQEQQARVDPRPPVSPLPWS